MSGPAPDKSDQRRPRRRRALAQILPLIALIGCERNGGLNYPTVAANGPTGNCPDRAVTEGGPGGYPTNDALRCSYADAQGKGQTKVRGGVYGEQPGMFPGQPLEGVTVTVHETKDETGVGKQLGRAHTDAQGHFTLAAMLPGNTYVVVARDSGGNELARTTLVSNDRNPNIPRVQLLVPMDPELRRAMRTGGSPGETPGAEAEPETASSEGAPATEALPPARPLPLGLPPR